MMSRPLVEVLTFEGCPNGPAALRLVEQVGSELRLDPEIRLVDVPDQEAAVRAGFSGLADDSRRRRRYRPAHPERRQLRGRCELQDLQHRCRAGTTSVT